jgi:hypothetical protein
LACTREIMTCCSWSVRISVRSLMEEFKREIGLKSPNRLGNPSWGLKW